MVIPSLVRSRTPELAVFPDKIRGEITSLPQVPRPMLVANSTMQHVMRGARDIEIEQYRWWVFEAAPESAIIDGKDSNT